MKLTRRDLVASGLALTPLSTALAGIAARNPTPDEVQSPFLSGNYAPVSEQSTWPAVRVRGRLPAGMHGLFVRNGPNPLFPPKPYHWFDGDGMAHGVWVENGRAVYANRFVMTSGLKREIEAGHNLFGGLLAEGQDKNTANTSLLWHHGRLLALMEAGSPYELSPRDLSTVGGSEYTFGGQWPAPLTAHPKVDQATGELVAFCYEPSAAAPKVHSVVFDATGNIRHHAALALPSPVMMHDFGVTARHSIFLDLPATFRRGHGLAFEPRLGARIGVLPRYGAASEVRWLEIEPCFIFHVLNAYEEGSKIVLDVARYETLPRIVAEGAEDATARPARYILDLESGSVTWDYTSERAAEFPRTADAVQGRKHRYGYYAVSDRGAFTGFLKLDYETGRAQTHRHGAGRHGGEPVFVARPGGTAEDDGWLVTYVYDLARQQSDLVVVDARQPEAGLLAAVELPVRIPYGFHGAWVPGVSHALSV